jgi:hypothetical protein
MRHVVVLASANVPDRTKQIQSFVHIVLKGLGDRKHEGRQPCRSVAFHICRTPGVSQKRDRWSPGCNQLIAQSMDIILLTSLAPQTQHTDETGRNRSGLDLILCNLEQLRTLRSGRALPWTAGRGLVAVCRRPVCELLAENQVIDAICMYGSSRSKNRIEGDVHVSDGIAAQLR